MNQILTETFDTQTQKAREQNLQTKKKTEEDIEMLDSYLQLFNNINQSTKSATSSYKDISNNIELVEDVGQEIELNLSRDRDFHFSQYNSGQPTQEDIERLCGKLTLKKVTLRLSETKEKQENSEECIKPIVAVE